MNKQRKSVSQLILFLCLMIILSACSSSTNGVGNTTAINEPVKQADSQGKTPADQEYQAFELTNLGYTQTFTEAPKRAVTLNQHVTEMMLALGLQDSMAGTAYLDDKILPEYEEAYSKIPVLSDKYPAKEVFMAAEPDFAYAGWQSAFTEKTLGTVQELAKAGMKTYVQESSNITAPTLDDVYKDIENIGRIFHVEAKATEVIDKMKADIEQITKQIGPVEQPLRVFVYDSGEDKAYTAANTYMTYLIGLAGGKNIFDDIQKSWAEVNWEEVVDRNPDVIVIVDYGDKSADQKRDLLLSKKELADLPAIANQRFIVLPLSAASEGIRAPLALKILAEGFYPDRFHQ
ncbi:ABC transporter substrate-binding protein [Brevibacillus sp. B_LB10_24]|uniref:ABC transporter substrate-binding protein n=1 Tax=Brevibacillus sp. B_LB10_24 TaxID=3380645 RepID=UPI0038B71890